MSMPGRKMFKVLCPMESPSGHKWWMRMGSAFMNKDASINIYLDAVPTKPGSHLQLRELTDEDLRISNDRRAAFNAPRNSNGVAQTGDHVSARHGDVGANHAASPNGELDFPPPADAYGAANRVPF